MVAIALTPTQQSLLETSEIKRMMTGHWLVNTPAPAFCLPDHQKQPHTLKSLAGRSGLLLGFIGDVWRPTSVRRILWLKRHAQKFAALGTPVALLVCDQPHTLFGFQMSSELPVPFPVLADPDGSVHTQYAMHCQPGLALIDRGLIVREAWLVNEDRVWPKMTELVQSIQTMTESHYTLSF